MMLLTMRSNAAFDHDAFDSAFRCCLVMYSLSIQREGREGKRASNAERKRGECENKDRRADSRSDRQTDRQTDIESEQRERERERERER